MSKTRGSMFSEFVPKKDIELNNLYQQLNDKIAIRDEKIEQLTRKLEEQIARVSELEISLLNIELIIQNAIPVSDLPTSGGRGDANASSEAGDVQHEDERGSSGG